MSNFKVEFVLDAKALIDEGPHYDCDNNELIWVDIKGKTINFFKLADSSNKSRFQFSAQVSAAILSKSGKNILCIIGRNICLVDCVTGT